MSDPGLRCRRRRPLPAWVCLRRETMEPIRVVPARLPCAFGHPLGCGVTGNTADSGSVIQGSIPCTPTNQPALVAGWRRFRRRHRFAESPAGAGRQPGERSRLVHRWAVARLAHRSLARSSSGLGHHPLKVAARVRIPYGLPDPGQGHSSEWPFSVHGCRSRATLYGRWKRCDGCLQAARRVMGADGLPRGIAALVVEVRAVCDRHEVPVEIPPGTRADRAGSASGVRFSD